MTELLTAPELAIHLRVRPDTIRRWARDGLIPALRVTGKVVRFDLEQVCATLRTTQAHTLSRTGTASEAEVRDARA